MANVVNINTVKGQQELAEHLTSVVNGQIMVDSRDVAGHFGRLHKNVLTAIDNIVAENSATKNMYVEKTREYRGRSFRYYLMNRDGFTMLVMGFNGSRASEWKYKYIQAFNQMEKELKARDKDELILNMGTTLIKTCATLNKMTESQASILNKLDQLCERVQDIYEKVQEKEKKSKKQVAVRAADSKVEQLNLFAAKRSLTRRKGEYTLSEVASMLGWYSLSAHPHIKFLVSVLRNELGLDISFDKAYETYFLHCVPSVTRINGNRIIYCLYLKQACIKKLMEWNREHNGGRAYQKEIHYRQKQYGNKIKDAYCVLPKDKRRVKYRVVYKEPEILQAENVG